MVLIISYLSELFLLKTASYICGYICNSEYAYEDVKEQARSYIDDLLVIVKERSKEKDTDQRVKTELQRIIFYSLMSKNGGVYSLNDDQLKDLLYAQLYVVIYPDR